MVKLTEKTLTEVCLSSAAKYTDKTALAMLREGKICRKITYKQMGCRSQQFGQLLRQLGMTDGQRVLLLSENSPEWVFAYFGIAFAGAVSVPLLTGFSKEQVQNIANLSEISAVALSRTMAEKIIGANLFSQIPIIYIDSITNNDEITISRNGIEEQMQLHTEENSDLPLRGENELASIIYTSGTSGNSKGVMLSGKNIISSALATLVFKKLFPRDRILSVLPLAHSYECSLGLIAPLLSGASITYLNKPPSSSVLLPAVKALRPTTMLTVPLFIEKIYNSSIAPKLRESKLYKFRLTRKLVIRAAGRRLKSALGGRIRIFGIGGAPLSAEVESFLHRARFPYTIGYGLTEASPLVAGNTPLRFPVHSTGTAADGVSLRVQDCGFGAYGVGEVQLKGPNVMMGYYNNSEQTAQAFTLDGWLKTGDLGRIDKKGRLHVRGRIKALILSPSGENIYPEEIEGLLGSSRLIEDALVYSGEKGELIAMVRLNEAAKAAADATLHALEELRSWVNKKLAAFSRLSKIEVRDEPFEKTPTMKIKRYLYV